MAVLIKKYKNRRLYDTDKSQYITVDTLRQYILDGVEFKVEDASSGRDLTNATLLQVLVEMEAGTTHFFSSVLLRQLIVLASHPMHHAFKETLEKMVSMLNSTTQESSAFKDYQKAGEVWQNQMQQMISHWQKLFSS